MPKSIADTRQNRIAYATTLAAVEAEAVAPLPADRPIEERYAAARVAKLIAGHDLSCPLFPRALLGHPRPVRATAQEPDDQAVPLRAKAFHIVLAAAMPMTLVGRRSRRSATWTWRCTRAKAP